MANLDYDLSNSVASISVARTVINNHAFRKSPKQMLDMNAFHECMELALAELSWFAQARYIDRYRIPEARHRLIRRMEHLCLPYVKEL